MLISTNITMNSSQMESLAQKQILSAFCGARGVNFPRSVLDQSTTAPETHTLICYHGTKLIYMTKTLRKVVGYDTDHSCP